MSNHPDAQLHQLRWLRKVHALMVATLAKAEQDFEKSKTKGDPLAIAALAGDLLGMLHAVLPVLRAGFDNLQTQLAPNGMRLCPLCGERWADTEDPCCSHCELEADAAINRQADKESPQ